MCPTPGPTLYTTQCVNPPSRGASGSCRTSTKDLVFGGASFQDNSGEAFSPSLVYLRGISAPSWISALVSCIAAHPFGDSLLRVRTSGSRCLHGARDVLTAPFCIRVRNRPAWLGEILWPSPDSPATRRPRRNSEEYKTDGRRPTLFPRASPRACARRKDDHPRRSGSVPVPTPRRRRESHRRTGLSSANTAPRFLFHPSIPVHEWCRAQSRVRVR